MRHMRLFKCSNDNGFFVVTEKYADFCQVKRISFTFRNRIRSVLFAAGRPVGRRLHALGHGHVRLPLERSNGQYYRSEIRGEKRRSETALFCERATVRRFSFGFCFQLYIQHLRTREPDRPRKLRLTVKNSEPIEFRKCFHAWSKHKNPPRDLEKQNAFSQQQPPSQGQTKKKPAASNNIFV